MRMSVWNWDGVISKRVEATDVSLLKSGKNDLFRSTVHFQSIYMF